MTARVDGTGISSLAFFRRESSIYVFFCLLSVFVGASYMVLPGYLFVIAGVLLAIFLVGIVRPEYTFYLLLFVLVEEMVHIFISYAPVYEVRLYPYKIPLLATALGLALAKVSRGFDFVRTPLDLPLLMILFYEAVSLIWAPVPSVGLWLLVWLLLNYLLFFVAKNIVRNEAVLRRAVRVWIAAGVVAAAAIAASQWIGEQLTIYLTPESGIKLAFDEHVSRPAGLAGGDHVAGFVSMALFITLGTMASEKRRTVKAIYLAIVLFMLLGIVLATSRGVIIGVAAGYIFFIMMHSHFKGKFLRYMFLSGVVMLFVVLLAKPGFIDRMLIGFGYTGELLFSDKTFHGHEAMTEIGQGLSGMEIRWIWWKNALDAMGRDPLQLIFGQGVGGFYYYSAGGTTVTSPEANGIFPGFFYDMGIFGCVLFLVILVLVASSLIRRFRSSEKNYVYYILLGAASALVAETGVHGLVDYDLVSYGSKYFWFPLGFVMAVLNIGREPEEVQAGPPD